MDLGVCLSPSSCTCPRCSSRVRLVSAISIPFVVVSKSTSRMCQYFPHPCCCPCCVVRRPCSKIRSSSLSSLFSILPPQISPCDSLGLISSSCSSSCFHPLRLHHQRAAHPLLYCKIKKSHNARATLFTISRLPLIFWFHLVMFDLLASIKKHVFLLDEIASVHCTSSALKGAQPPLRLTPLSVNGMCIHRVLPSSFRLTPEWTSNDSSSRRPGQFAQPPCSRSFGAVFLDPS
jgi:hypothetical protein